jgi:hypothetical protein
MHIMMTMKSSPSKRNRMLSTRASAVVFLVFLGMVMAFVDTAVLKRIAFGPVSFQETTTSKTTPAVSDDSCQPNT